MSTAENPIHIFKGHRTPGERFVRAPITGRKEIVLIEPESEVKLTEKTLRSGLLISRALAIARDRIDFWTSRYNRRATELHDIGTNHEALRGFGNIDAVGHEAQLIPTIKKTTYDTRLLRESLGSSFNKYFEEKVIALVDTSTGLTQDSVKKTLLGKLLRVGVSAFTSEQPKILSVNTIIEPINKEALQKAINDGEITLLEGAINHTMGLEVKVQHPKRERLPRRRKNLLPRS